MPFCNLYNYTIFCNLYKIYTMLFYTKALHELKLALNQKCTCLERGAAPWVGRDEGCDELESSCPSKSTQILPPPPPPTSLVPLRCSIFQTNQIYGPKAAQTSKCDPILQLAIPKLQPLPSGKGESATVLVNLLSLPVLSLGDPAMEEWSRGCPLWKADRSW